MMSVSLVVFSCSKWMNDQIKRYRGCSSAERDAILLAWARMEHQGWTEARCAQDARLCLGSLLLGHLVIGNAIQHHRESFVGALTLPVHLQQWLAIGEPR